ncbi:MAG: dephospho-CoA kinase [Planctomycetota bacterium]
MPLKLIILGLIGGIGSGKTHVAKIFKGLGAKLIEADKIAYTIINHPRIKRTLLKWYGCRIIKKTGQIDRKKLAEVSFNNLKNLRRLNKLTHPYIKKGISNQLEQLNNNHRLRRTGVVVIDAPLLLETGLYKFCDYIVFIKTSYKIRLKRVLISRKWNSTEIKKREQYQIPLLRKQSKADFIINNNKSLYITTSQIKNISQLITKNMIELSIKMTRFNLNHNQLLP